MLGRRHREPTFDVREDLRRLEEAIRNYHQLAVLQDAGVYEVADRLRWSLHDLRAFSAYRRPTKEQVKNYAATLEQAEADRQVVSPVLDDMASRLQVRRTAMQQQRSASAQTEAEPSQLAETDLQVMPQQSAAAKQDAKQQRKAAARQQEAERQRRAAEEAERRWSQRIMRDHQDRASEYRQARLRRQASLEGAGASRSQRPAAADAETLHMGNKAWQQAEQAAAAYLRQHGYEDASVTPPGNDKGLDVVGRAVTAQVKYQSKPVGAPLLQQAVGASGGREVVFFSRCGYTAAAVQYALDEEVALFTLELPGAIEPVNRRARLIASQ